MWSIPAHDLAGAGAHALRGPRGLPDEIHVHGFDEYADVAAGRSVTLSFDARFDGAYEVEMHESGTQVATLEIQP